MLGYFLCVVQVVEIPKQLEGKLAHNAIKEIREKFLISRAELFYESKDLATGRRRRKDV